MPVLPTEPCLGNFDRDGLAVPLADKPGAWRQCKSLGRRRYSASALRHPIQFPRHQQRQPAVALFLQPLGNDGLWLAFLLFMASRGIGMHIVYRRTVLPSLIADHEQR